MFELFTHIMFCGLALKINLVSRIYGIQNLLLEETRSFAKISEVVSAMI